MGHWLIVVLSPTHHGSSSLGHRRILISSGCLLVVPLSVVLTGWLLTDTHIRRMMYVGVSFLRCCHWLVVERYTYTAVDTLVWWRIIYIWGIG